MASSKRLFECQQCGSCCRWFGHVLITGLDIKRLAVASGLSEEAFIACYTVLAVNRHQLSLADGPDGSCILLKGSCCTLYEARPDQCRDFPHGWRITEGCPALETLAKTDSV